MQHDRTTQYYQEYGIDAQAYYWGFGFKAPVKLSGHSKPVGHITCSQHDQTPAVDVPHYAHLAKQLLAASYPLMETTLAEYIIGLLIHRKEIYKFTQLANTTTVADAASSLTFHQNRPEGVDFWNDVFNLGRPNLPREGEYYRLPTYEELAEWFVRDGGACMHKNTRRWHRAVHLSEHSVSMGVGTKKTHEQFADQYVRPDGLGFRVAVMPHVPDAVIDDERHSPDTLLDNITSTESKSNRRANGDRYTEVGKAVDNVVSFIADKLNLAKSEIIKGWHPTLSPASYYTTLEHADKDNYSEHRKFLLDYVKELLITHGPMLTALKGSERDICDNRCAILDRFLHPHQQQEQGLN